MPCVHRLGDEYPGLFCLYCGQPSATIGADRESGGQIYLERDGRRRYVAVIYKDKQKVVKELDDQQEHLVVRFGDGDEAEVRTHELLLAFQNPEEVLKIEQRP